MTVADAIAALPDDCRCAVVVGSGELTIGDLRLALAVDSGDRAMTTVQCATEWGHAPEWWQDRARDGSIHGAYQESEGSQWYIPRGHAKVFLREYREGRRKRGSRRPWKGPQKAA
mgnify:CR=1 FL=1